MSRATKTCEQIIGTCVQFGMDGDLLYVTDCQLTPDTQQVVIRGLNMARRTVELIVEWRSIEPLFMRLINHDTFLMRLERCPLCGQAAPTATKLFTVIQLFWEVKVLQCCKCGLAYKEYVPNGLLLDQIYGTDYVHFSEPVDKQGEISKYRLRVKRMGQPRGRHLDYGCGAGHLVACAMQAGWDSYGADPYLPILPVSESLAGRLFRLDVSDSAARHELGNFDCITLWAVFEHLAPLRETLAALVKMLNPGGQLILNAPNANSLIAQRSGANWRIAVLLEHLQFCSSSCAQWIATQNNLTIYSLRFCGSPFPFGSGPTDASGQGLSALPAEFVTLIEDGKNNLVASSNVSRPSWSKRLLTLGYQSLMYNGGTGLFAAVIRQAVHLLRMGDHVEVVFIRSLYK